MEEEKSYTDTKYIEDIKSKMRSSSRPYGHSFDAVSSEKFFKTYGHSFDAVSSEKFFRPYGHSFDAVSSEKFFKTLRAQL